MSDSCTTVASTRQRIRTRDKFATWKPSNISSLLAGQFSESSKAAPRHTQDGRNRSWIKGDYKMISWPLTTSFVSSIYFASMYRHPFSNKIPPYCYWLVHPPTCICPYCTNQSAPRFGRSYHAVPSPTTPEHTESLSQPTSTTAKFRPLCTIQLFNSIER